MPRPVEVGWHTLGIADGLNRQCPLGSRDPCSRGAMIDRNGIVGTKRGGVVLHHGRKLKAVPDLGKDGHAKLPPPVGDHEIDGLRRHFLCRADKIAFVLSIFGINDDHHLTAGNGGYGVFDTGK